MPTDGTMADQANRRFRTIWISDLHLGTRGCQAERVMDFLRRTECETMYLVGDIIDIWRLKVARYWPQSHNDVVQKLLRRARKGCRMIYVPGNHDDAMRNYLDYEFGRVQVVGDWIHETADGRTLLVIHGDQFDSVVARAPWIGRLGTHANAASQLVNQWFNVGRRRLGYPYWSLSGYLKQKVRHRGDFIKNYETALAAEARRRGVAERRARGRGTPPP